MYKFLNLYLDEYAQIAAVAVYHNALHLARLGLVVCYRTCHDIDYSDEVNCRPNIILDSVIIYYILLFLFFNVISNHYDYEIYTAHRVAEQFDYER